MCLSSIFNESHSAVSRTPRRRQPCGSPQLSQVGESAYQEVCQNAQLCDGLDPTFGSSYDPLASPPLADSHSPSRQSPQPVRYASSLLPFRSGMTVEGPSPLAVLPNRIPIAPLQSYHLLHGSAPTNERQPEQSSRFQQGSKKCGKKPDEQSTRVPGEHTWVLYGEKDPQKGNRVPSTAEDARNRKAVSDKGGACSLCRSPKKKRRCDGDDHCKECKKRGIPSQQYLLECLRTSPYRSGTSSLSLSLSDRPSCAISVEATLEHGEQECFLDAWLRHTTEKIDNKQFLDDDTAKIEVVIVTDSDTPRKDHSNVVLSHREILNHLATPGHRFAEAVFTNAFLGRSIIRPSRKGKKKADELRDRIATKMSQSIAEASNYLIRLAEAPIYTRELTAKVKAFLAVIYHGLGALLMFKMEELSAFALESIERKFQYCARGHEAELVLDMMEALMEYRQVVTELAELSLEAVPDNIAKLLSMLKKGAADQLGSGCIDDQIELLKRFLTTSKHIKSADELHNTRSERVMRPFSIECRRYTIDTLGEGSTALFREPIALKVRDFMRAMPGPGDSSLELQADKLASQANSDSRPSSTEFNQTTPVGSAHLTLRGLNQKSSTHQHPGPVPSSSLENEHASLLDSQQDTQVASPFSETTQPDFANTWDDIPSIFSDPYQQITDEPDDYLGDASTHKDPYTTSLHDLEIDQSAPPATSTNAGDEDQGFCVVKPGEGVKRTWSDGSGNFRPNKQSRFHMDDNPFKPLANSALVQRLQRRQRH